MSADTSARLALQRELRDEILLHYGSGRPVVAVDGTAGSAAFADGLAETFAERGHAVVRASIEGFLRPRGDAGGEPGYVDRYDDEAFRDALVSPFRRGAEKGFRLAVTDPATGAPVDAEPTTTASDAVLIVDGPFLHRPEVVGLWNYSVYLDVPQEIAAERAASLAASASGPAMGPSLDAQRSYRAEVRPRTRAVAIVDDTDVDAPVRRFADSC
jgi:uridine kinase